MKRKTARKTVQLSSIGLLFLVPFLNRKGITVITGTLYSLAVGPVWLTDPVIGVQTVLTTRRFDSTLLLSLLLPVALAFVLGRVFCSWVCPQNTLSELFDVVADRTGIRRLFTLPFTPVLRYAVLILVLLASLLLRFPVVSLLSAPGIISVQAANLVYETSVGLELGLIALIVLLEVFVVRRAWCNHICPVGSFLGLLRNQRTMKVSFSESPARSCGGCRVCTDACRLGLDPMAGKVYPFCHNCGDCIAACEGVKGEENPLLFHFSGR
jgi:ferredoxin-type protein NapH